MLSRLVLLSCLLVFIQCSVFDEQLYEEVLDPVLCDEHLSLLTNNTLGLLRFIDASGKLPTGVLQGNLNDLGDYHYCLGIDLLIENRQIQGKYCSIGIPTPFDTRGLDISDTNLKPWQDDNDNAMKIYNGMKQSVSTVIEGRRDDLRTPLFDEPSTGLTLGVCVPRTCTPTQAVRFYLDLLPLPVSPNDTITERFCRLPGDKPFSAGDYAAIALLSFIGLLTLASTCYDVFYLFISKADPKRKSRYWSTFSVYTNTRRFLTVTSPPGALDCLDGIRVLSMLWVILGHTFAHTMSLSLSNPLFIAQYTQSFESVWVTASPIAVDTFFLLSGILCVYSTIGKISRGRFIKGIPLFYLHRLLRTFPLLATIVLLQSSLMNHLSDGPQWTNMATAVQACRDYWWLALLHIQNYSSGTLCLTQTWYLAVDVQLYIACPLVLVFLFGRRLQARLALAAALLATLFTTTFYSFYYNFPGVLFQPTRLADLDEFGRRYYMNTLTRATPFVIGMIYGYALHLFREKKVKFPKLYNVLLWLLSLGTMSLAVFHVPPLMQVDYENQLVDNLVNAFVRPLWALALGFIIFACVHGYGGPVNWFLSLRMWKLPARLSFAMYLTHFSLMYVSNGSITQTHYFAVGETVYRFAAELVWTVIAAFILSITIDAPCSTLQKMLLGGGRKPAQKEAIASATAPEKAAERSNNTVYKSSL